MLRWHKVILFGIIPLAGNNVSAQPGTEYVITTNNDTLLGKVTVHGALKPGYLLTIDTGEEKKSLMYTEVKEWKSRYSRFIPYSYQHKGITYYKDMEIIQDGPVRLVADVAVNMAEYYMYMQGKFVYVDKHNMVKIIWPYFLQCTVFKEAYGHTPKREMARLKSYWKQTELNTIVKFHNEKCK